MAQEKLDVVFVHVVYSSKGHVEGFMAHSEDANAQFVVDKDDEKSAAIIGGLSPGQSISLAAKRTAPSPKGSADHVVYSVARIASMDGARPKKSAAEAGYAGKVERFNFARHGAPNGYVLDTGDFIHVRPDGFRRLRLNVGDHVRAQGDAHWLSTGGGWAVEATIVNDERLD